MKLSPDLSRSAASANSGKSTPSPTKEKEAANSRSLYRCRRVRRRRELRRLRHQRRRVRLIMYGGVCLIPVVTWRPKASDLITSTILKPSDLPLFTTGCTVGKQGASIVKLLTTSSPVVECKYPYRLFRRSPRHVFCSKWFLFIYVHLISRVEAILCTFVLVRWINAMDGRCELELLLY